MTTQALETISITGRELQVTLPDICPHCGKPAYTPLTVAKAFQRRRRSGRGWQRYSIATSFRVPFCEECVQAHRQEMSPITLRQWLRFLFMAAAYGVPGLIALYAGLLIGDGGMANLRWNNMNDWIGTILLFSFVFYCLAMGSFFVRKGWRLGAPALVRPQTPITQSFDFTDALSSDFEPVWRQFTFTHPGYAQAFREVNAHRIWQTDSSRAEMARGLRIVRSVVVIGLVAVLALLALLGWLHKKNPPILEQLFG